MISLSNLINPVVGSPTTELKTMVVAVLLIVVVRVEEVGEICPLNRWTHT
jgi:hypothetical protein